MYVLQDLAYKLFCYINKGLIEAIFLEKILGLKDKPIQIERKMVVIIIKIIAKKTLVRQCKIPRLPYRIDLCFVAHKLVTKIYQGGYPYYKNDKVGQKLIDFKF